MGQYTPRESRVELYDTQPMSASAAPMRNVSTISDQDTASIPTRKAPRHQPSYHPTRFALANRALDVADRLTGGRAEWIQRLFSYLFVGGIAAIINLITLQLTMNALETAPFHIAFTTSSRLRSPRKSRSWRTLSPMTE